ncbi:vWA domain-containing protein [Rhizobium sp.]
MKPDIFTKALAALASSRAGNIGLTAAIVLPVLLAATGLAVDYTRLVNSQRTLQDALDAAAVSAAAAMMTGHNDATTVKAYATNVAIAELTPLLTKTELDEVKKKLVVTTTAIAASGVNSYDVKMTSSFQVPLTPFAKFLGYTKRDVYAASSSQSQSVTKNAMSMYVVLDRSGSMSFVTETLDSTKTKCQNYMLSNWIQYPNLATSKPCYVNKSGALKTAAASLFDQLDALEKKDPTDTIIRAGGVSFTDTMQTAQPMAWGTTAIRNYVTAIPAYPTGGTDMTGGMDAAYKALKDSAEANAHTSKGNASFSKFIVLMTDGENTGASNVWNPALDTKTLATCDAARKDGITIYTVAFMAPTNGINMLKNCAGTSSNAYVANDMQSLVKAFAEIGNKATQKATRITN